MAGDLLSNINRWHRQFGGESVTREAVEAGPSFEMLGAKAYLVEARGDYEPGFGKPTLKDQALLGVISQNGDRIVTVKLIAPPEVAQIVKNRTSWISVSRWIKNKGVGKASLEKSGVIRVLRKHPFQGGSLSWVVPSGWFVGLRFVTGNLKGWALWGRMKGFFQLRGRSPSKQSNKEAIQS